MAINCKKECNKALTSQSKLIFKEMWVHCKKTNKKKYITSQKRTEFDCFIEI